MLHTEMEPGRLVVVVQLLDIPAPHVPGVPTLVPRLLEARQVLKRGTVISSIYGYYVWTVRYADGEFAYHLPEELDALPAEVRATLKDLPRRLGKKAPPPDDGRSMDRGLDL